MCVCVNSTRHPFSAIQNIVHYLSHLYGSPEICVRNGFNVTVTSYWSPGKSSLLHESVNSFDIKSFVHSCLNSCLKEACNWNMYEDRDNKII